MICRRVHSRHVARPTDHRRFKSNQRARGWYGQQKETWEAMKRPVLGTMCCFGSQHCFCPGSLKENKGTNPSARRTEVSSSQRVKLLLVGNHGRSVIVSHKDPETTEMFRDWRDSTDRPAHREKRRRSHVTHMVP